MHICIVDKQVKLAVRQYLPFPFDDQTDPFTTYKDFLARTYLSKLEDAIEIVSLSSVVCHFAQYAMSDRIAVLALWDYVTM